MEELSRQVGPSEKVVRGIDEYVKSIGGREIEWSYGKEYVQFYLTVREAESAFQTTISQYTHKVSQRSLLRADSFSLSIPSHIEQHLDLTLGLLDFFGISFPFPLPPPPLLILFYYFILFFLNY